MRRDRGSRLRSHEEDRIRGRCCYGCRWVLVGRGRRGSFLHYMTEHYALTFMVQVSQPERYGR
jgi:hypothetical protein